MEMEARLNWMKNLNETDCMLGHKHTSFDME